MKKVFKVTGYLLLTLVLLLGLSALYIQIKGVPNGKFAPTPEIANLIVPKGDTALIQRGLKIANIVCKDCHRSPEGQMSGQLLGELPPMFGKVYSGNITHDSIHGVGGWTDGELYYFLRTGVRKDGSWAPPFMPKFSRLADEDVRAIIAWLRSDDPTLAAEPRTYLPNHWNFVVKALANTMFSPPPIPEKPILLPDPADKVALGKYLANDVFDCYACHSADMVKVDIMNPPNSAGYYGGGQEMRNKEGKPVRTANLTPHPEYGIGKLTTEEFVNAIKYGKKPGGGTLSSPMPPFATLTDDEAAAIQAFLKTVPAIANKVDRTIKP